MLRELCPQNTEISEVPDPYYGSSNGFDRVFDLIEAASEGLLEEIETNYIIGMIYRAAQISTFKPPTLRVFHEKLNLPIKTFYATCSVTLYKSYCFP